MLQTVTLCHQEIVSAMKQNTAPAPSGSRYNSGSLQRHTRGVVWSQVTPDIRGMLFLIFTADQHDFPGDVVRYK